jgi:hypothetical protein
MRVETMRREQKLAEAVTLVGGPFDGQTVNPATLATFGTPTKYIVPRDHAESCVYARLSPSALGYRYTMSDE